MVFGKGLPPVSEWYLLSSTVSFSFSYEPKVAESEERGSKGDGGGPCDQGSMLAKAYPSPLCSLHSPYAQAPPNPRSYLLQQLQGRILVPGQAL